MEWLEVSGAKRCELCGYHYHFSPLYSSDRPDRLSLVEFVQLACLKILRVAPWQLRAVLVRVLLVTLVPFTVCWIFRLWMMRTSLGLPDDTSYFSFDVLLHELYAGGFICAVAVALALAVFTCVRRLSACSSRCEAGASRRKRGGGGCGGGGARGDRWSRRRACRLTRCEEWRDEDRSSLSYVRAAAAGIAIAAIAVAQVRRHRHVCAAARPTAPPARGGGGGSGSRGGRGQRGSQSTCTSRSQSCCSAGRCWCRWRWRRRRRWRWSWGRCSVCYCFCGRCCWKCCCCCCCCCCC